MLLTTFLNIGTEDITSMIGYASDLIGNLMPVIVVILGVSVGLWIFRTIFHKGE